MYYVYMIRCNDDSLYTGFTNDLNSRMKKHWTGKGAKYTKSRKPMFVEMVWSCESETGARKLEYAIKSRLRKDMKEMLIKNPELTSLYFSDLSCFDIKAENYTYTGEDDG